MLESWVHYQYIDVALWVMQSGLWLFAGKEPFSSNGKALTEA